MWEPLFSLSLLHPAAKSSVVLMTASQLSRSLISLLAKSKKKQRIFIIYVCVYIYIRNMYKNHNTIPKCFAKTWPSGRSSWGIRGSLTGWVSLSRSLPQREIIIGRCSDSGLPPSDLATTVVSEHEHITDIPMKTHTHTHTYFQYTPTHRWGLQHRPWKRNHMLAGLD